MEEATRIIWRRLKQIYKNGIPKEDLENLKKQWIRSLILQSEDLEGRMNAILQDSFLGRKYRSIATIKKGIEKIDNDSVKNFIKDYYHYKNISLLVFSNDKKEKVLKLGEIIS